MNEWNNIDAAPPPTDILLLVYQHMTGQCLRSFAEDGDMYDEHNNYDDSELEVTHWQRLPDDPDAA